jgi:hypothetical protein
MSLDLEENNVPERWADVRSLPSKLRAGRFCACGLPLIQRESESDRCLAGRLTCGACATRKKLLRADMQAGQGAIDDGSGVPGILRDSRAASTPKLAHPDVFPR